MNTVDQTQKEVRTILTTGKRKSEYLLLYKIYYPLKKSQPAIYGMVVATICERLKELGLSGPDLFVLNKLWHL